MLIRLVAVVAWPGCLAVTGFLTWQRWALGRLEAATPSPPASVVTLDPDRSLTGYVAVG